MVWYWCSYAVKNMAGAHLHRARRRIDADETEGDDYRCGGEQSNKPMQPPETPTDPFGAKNGQGVFPVGPDPPSASVFKR